MYLGLDGNVALVTAASRGIGRSVAESLAREGMTVIAAARTVGETEEEICEGRIVPWKADLSDETATEELIADVVAKYGRLDVVVLNTPGPKILPVLDTTWADWEAAQAQLLRPVVVIGTAAARQMREQKSGSLILMASTWVRQPAPGGVLSAAYRSAAASFMKSLASELAPYNVRVNQVLPGATGTDRMTGIVEMKSERNNTSVDDEIKAVVKDIPLGRWAEASEIADAVAFIASTRASFITGSTMTIDGGAVRAVH